MNDLINQHCQNSKSVTKLSTNEIKSYLINLTNWSMTKDESKIIAQYEFKNFKQTMFFINAVAFLCEQECHHPEVTFGFNYCNISLNTHDVNGISINDFICAAKINALLSM